MANNEAWAVRLPRRLRQPVKLQAARELRTVSDLVKDAIDLYLKSAKRAAAK